LKKEEELKAKEATMIERKRKLEHNKDKESSPSTTWKISYFGTAIDPSTPLNTLPPGFSYDALQTNFFDDVVVSLGEYYYSISKKEISKRLDKRPRIKGDTIIQETPKWFVTWKLSNNDPQKEAIDTTSTLNAFVGVHLIIVNEINATLDNYKTKVISLEDQLK